MNQIDIGEIIALTKLHPLKVRNVYLFGSRVYGNSRVNSDYDVMVVAVDLLSTRQVLTDRYSINIRVPTTFEDDLRAHDLVALECIWAPDFAKLQVKTDYAQNFVLDVNRLKTKLLTQSHNAWHQAKMAIIESDILRGQKRVGHALKILMFGIQIVKHGKIVDFSEANSLYDEIANSNQFEWEYFRNKYLPLKRKLENSFKQSGTIQPQ